jgi:hypothetical protein
MDLGGNKSSRKLQNNEDTVDLIVGFRAVFSYCPVVIG